MKIHLPSLAAIVLATTTVFISCKKESEQSTTSNKTEIETHVDDQNRVASDMDDVSADADAALEANVYFSGRTQNGSNMLSICGASAVADSTNSIKRITITYNGNNCQGTTYRTGTVVLSMPTTQRWKNAGAAVTVTYQNLKVKRLSDNKSITFNGTQTITNVSGGLLMQLASMQSITHTVTGNNMSLTFDDNSQRNWNVARKKVYTYNNGLVLTVSGIGIVGNTSNAAEWGTTRFGQAFVTSIAQPLVIRQDCNFRLTAGELKHEGFATSTVTFGLNAAGQATTCPGNGNYFLKLVWSGPNGASVTALLPY